MNAFCSVCFHLDGVIAAISRGVVGLVNVKLADGSHLIANKFITGFSNAEEEADKWVDKLPVHGALRTDMVENMIISRGAKFSTGTDAAGSHVKVDQRVITAQNPASAAEFCTAILSALSSDAPAVHTTKRRPSLTQPVQVLNVPQIFKEGWMDKMGHSLLSGWTRRWFSMHRRPDGEVVLEYWVNETKLLAEHKGLFIIDEGTEIELEDVSGRKHCFRLKNSHGSYLLSAGSILEMDQWINVIRNRGRQRKGTMTETVLPHQSHGPAALPKKVNMMFTACALMQCWADHDRTSFSSFVTEGIKMSKSGTENNFDVTGMDSIWKARIALGDSSLNSHCCDSFIHTAGHMLKCVVRVCEKHSMDEIEKYNAVFHFDVSEIKVTRVELVRA